MFLNIVKDYIRMFARFVFVLITMSIMSESLSAQNIDKHMMERTQNKIERKFPNVPSVSVNDFVTHLAESDGAKPLIIDVRDSAEFAVSHINGAMNYPLNQVSDERIHDLPYDRALLVYCSVGYRSAEFVRYLQNKGFNNAYNLEGGIFEWKNVGRPVFRDGIEVNVVHPYNAKWGKLLDADSRWQAA